MTDVIKMRDDRSMCKCRCKDDFDFSDHIVHIFAHLIIPAVIETAYAVLNRPALDTTSFLTAVNGPVSGPYDGTNSKSLKIQKQQEMARKRDQVRSFLVYLASAAFVILGLRTLVFTCMFFHTPVENLVSVVILISLLTSPIYWLFSGSTTWYYMTLSSYPNRIDVVK